jgi:hypothetical protein
LSKDDIEPVWKEALKQLALIAAISLVLGLTAALVVRVATGSFRPEPTFEPREYR